MEREITKEPKIALCRRCGGTGKVGRELCRQCQGSGRVIVSCRMMVEVTPYIERKPPKQTE